jgi:hypothetical protein
MTRAHRKFLRHATRTLTEADSLREMLEALHAACAKPAGEKRLGRKRGIDRRSARSQR